MAETSGGPNRPPVTGMDRPAKTSESSSKYLNMLVYGRSGVGKTYLAGTGPKPVYIIDCDKGTMSLADSEEVYFERVTTLDEILSRVSYLQKGFKADPDFYKVVVFDNLSEGQQLILHSLTGGKQPEIRDWGNILTTMSALIRDIRDLPCHKLWIAQQYTGKDGIISPALSGSISSKIPEYFDVVANYASKTIAVPIPGTSPQQAELQNIRALQCWISPEVVAKDRSGRLEEFEKPNLGRIIKKIQAPRPKAETATVAAAAVKKETQTDGK